MSLSLFPRKDGEQRERRQYKPTPAGIDPATGQPLYGLGVVSNTQGFNLNTDDFIELCPPTTRDKALRRAQELNDEFNNS